MLRAAAQHWYPNPQDAEDPMVAPPENEIRPSGRVLELQNKGLWLRYHKICPGIFPSSLPFVKKLVRTVVQDIREVEDQRGQDRGGQQEDQVGP